ncbi:Hypothetical protein A7982_09959 [Minicystis rosea]|nr:Hypothetical protein A7982_09959 [Minicystis rosea]
MIGCLAWDEAIAQKDALFRRYPRVRFVDEVIHEKVRSEQWQAWDGAFRRLVDEAALPRFPE